MSGWHRDVARPAPPLNGDMGTWLAEQVDHSDPAIRQLARAWAGQPASPVATVETLAYAVRRSWRSSAALERAAVAWRVQTHPGAFHVACSDCGAAPQNWCANPISGYRINGFHRDRRRRADQPVARAVAHDLRLVQAARNDHHTSTTNPKEAHRG